jgi:hypothetical protein
MPGITGVIGTETEAKTLLKHISNSIKKIVTGNNPIHAGSMLRKKHFEKLLSVFDFDNNTINCCIHLSIQWTKEISAFSRKS